MEFSIIDILRFYIDVMDNKKFLSSKETLNYMVENYNFDESDCKYQTALLINNFLLVYGEIVNDLKEITERIRYIDEKMPKLNSGGYEFKKLNYFKSRNIKVKAEVEKFLMYDVAKYVKERVIHRKKWIRSSTDLGKMLDKLPYDYSFYKRYYDPEYDFSTESKFCFLLEHNREAIDIKIETRENNPSKYFNDVDKIIKSRGLLKKIVSGIEGHHRLKNRVEIFDTLCKLYEDGLYQSFINLAVIQIEGLFYDFCVVIDDEQEIDNMGTLSEKAEKIFISNLMLWLSIYPYFAFEVPIFRNKIAHSGLWSEDNIKGFANELILDLYTILEIIKLPYVPPNNLLNLFVSIRREIKHLEFTEGDYEIILKEMFLITQFGKGCPWNIFTLLKGRGIKQELFEHYIISISDDVNTNLYEECNRLTKVIYNEKFWDIVLIHTQKVHKHEPGGAFDFIDFIKLITNNYINEFKSNTLVKGKCIEVKKELKRFDIK